MKKHFLTACGLWAIAILLFMNFFTAFFQPGNVFAQKDDAIGRYQISAWASPSKGSIQFSGYYVVDTTTGKMVAKHSERLGVDR